MTVSKLQFNAPFISAESLAMGSAAESIATAGGTIPQGTGEIYFFVPSGKTVRYHPTGTPTSTFGHEAKALKWGRLKMNEQGAKLFSTDSSDATLILLYMRGAGRQDAAYSISEPN
jgi:hypothetical protein